MAGSRAKRYVFSTNLLAILTNPMIVLTEELNLKLPTEDNEVAEPSAKLEDHPYSRYFAEYVSIMKEEVLGNKEPPPFENSWLSTIIILRGFALLKLLFVFETRRRISDIRYFVQLVSQEQDFFALRKSMGLEPLIEALNIKKVEAIRDATDNAAKKRYGRIKIEDIVNGLEEMASGLWILTNVELIRLLVCRYVNVTSFANDNIHKSVLERRWGFDDITSLNVIPPKGNETFAGRNEELRNSISEEINGYKHAMGNDPGKAWERVLEKLDTSSMNLISGLSLEQELKSASSRTDMSSSKKISYGKITQSYRSKSNSKQGTETVEG